MQTVHKILAGGALLFYVSHAWAWNPFKSKLQAYECTTLSEAMACSAGCKPKPNVKFEFIVNVEKSLVTVVVFKEGLQVNSGLLENCKVTDLKNWACKEQFESTAIGSNSVQSMANGRFYSWRLSTTYPNRRLGIKAHHSEESTCAK